MQRTYYIGIIISIVIMQIAQIIFSIVYNPLQRSHRWIPYGNRTRYITSTGFQQSQQSTYISTMPVAVNTTGTIKTYNKNCIFWLGQCQSIIFQQSKAILTWLNTIQYIGKNVNTSLVNNLTNHIDSVITFAPKWIYPYILANILWPTINTEQRSTWVILTWENSITLGEEWILYTCDIDKIKKIQELTYTKFLEALREKNKDIWNPCQDYRLPHILAFNYYQYLHNNQKAELYYKIAAMHDGVPSITSAMPAIIQSSQWDYLTSASIRYDRFQESKKQYQQESQQRNKSNDKLYQFKKETEHSLQKTVQQTILYILSLTYPKWLSATEWNIHSKDINKTIDNILQNCTQDPILCELIELILQSWAISKNSSIITLWWYQRDTDIWRWKLVVHQ